MRSRRPNPRRGWMVAVTLSALLLTHQSARAVGWWTGFALPPNGKGLTYRAYAMAVYGNALVVGGGFQQAGYNPDTRYIGAFSGTSWAGLHGGMDDDVITLATVGSHLYAGGRFLIAGGTSASHIARWNGSSWSALGSGVNGDVAVIATFGSDLVVGGWFEEAGGGPAANIARWDGSTWSSLALGLDGIPVAIAEFNGDLYVSGDFTTAGGSPATYLAKWNGTAWSAVDVTLTGINGWYGSPVNVLSTAYNGNLLVGGDFSHLNGIYCNGLAEWDGETWTPRGAGLDDGAVVSDVASYHGDLVAYGALGLPECSLVARWNGTSWAALGTGLSLWDLFGQDGTLAIFGDDLYAGGNISRAGDQASSFIARWMEPDPTAAPALSVATAKWSVRPMQTPSRGTVNFEFAVARTGEMTLDIVNAAGRMIRRLPGGMVQPGMQWMTWDGLSVGGAPAPAGVYFVRLTTDGETMASGKVVLVR